MDLIEEYETKLRAGAEPKISDYVARYKGKDVEEFEKDLRLAAILTLDGMERRRRAREARRRMPAEKLQQRIMERIRRQE